MQNIKQYTQRFIEILPIVAPAAIASFAVPIIILLLFDAFKNVYIWPLGLLAAGATVYVVNKHFNIDRPGSTKEQQICDSLVAALVIIWVIINGLFTFQHIFTNRDPATYANGGIWLIENDSIRIDRPDMMFEGVEGVKNGSAGFKVSPHDETVHHAQGAHLLPALLGLGGRLGGAGFLLHLNPLFGGAALLALYGFIRLLTKPRWAVVTVAAFACSLPLIYFSRDTYTEPLTATFTFGALSLLYVAMKKKSASYSLWALAGVVGGATTMTRIDGFLIVIAIVSFMAIYLALARSKEHTERLKQAGAFIGGILVTAVLGWLDLLLLSTGYFHDLSEKFNKMMAMLLGVLIFGVIVVLLSWRTNILKWLNKKTKKWRAPAAVIFVALVVLGLASQPLWRTAYSKHVNPFVVSLQESRGIDPMLAVNERGKELSRNYAENAVYWTVWYIGPVVAVLSAAGIAVATYKVVNGKKDSILYLPVLLVVGGSALVYFVRASITPDQIWASRRFLPVVLPGMATFGALGLSELWRLPKKRLLRMDGKIVATIVGTLAIVAPAIISLPFVNLREYTPHLSRINDVCNALPEESVIAWVGIARLQAVQPTNSICKVPTANLKIDGKTTELERKEILKEVAMRAETNNHTPIVGVYNKEMWVLGDNRASNLTEVHSSMGQMMEATLLRPPHTRYEVDNSVSLGVIQGDGTIQPLEQHQ